MKNEFQINDILNAVNSISQIEKKKSKTTIRKKDSTDNNDVLSLDNQVKSSESNILVLDKMIE